MERGIGWELCQKQVARGSTLLHQAPDFPFPLRDIKEGRQSQQERYTTVVDSLLTRKPLCPLRPEILFSFPETLGQMGEGLDGWRIESHFSPTGIYPSLWPGVNPSVLSGITSKDQWKPWWHQLNEAVWNNTAKARKSNCHWNHSPQK